MQEIEFQSLWNPRTPPPPRDFSHLRKLPMEFAGSTTAWTGNVKLFLQSTPLPFNRFYHLGKETTANLSHDRVKVAYIWRAYNRVGIIPGLTHRTVNHSLFFVDPVNGVHTQNIESYWNRCKVKLNRIKEFTRICWLGI